MPVDSERRRSRRSSRALLLRGGDATSSSRCFERTSSSPSATSFHDEWEPRRRAREALAHAVRPGHDQARRGRAASSTRSATRSARASTSSASSRDALARRRRDRRRARDPVAIDLAEVPRALRDAARPRRPTTLRARFELPGRRRRRLPRRARTRSSRASPRTSLDTALDPLRRAASRARCGVDPHRRRRRRRTTLLLVRLRFDIVTRTRRRRAARCSPRSAARSPSTGAPERAEWLDDDAADALLDAEPDGNVPPEQAAQLVERVVDGLDALAPALERVRRRARASSSSTPHARVREAPRCTGVTYASSRSSRSTSSASTSSSRRRRPSRWSCAAPRRSRRSAPRAASCRRTSSQRVAGGRPRPRRPRADATTTSAEASALNEAIARSLEPARRRLGALPRGRARGCPTSDPGTTSTRERWLLPLFEELGFGRLQPAEARRDRRQDLPVSHAWGSTSRSTSSAATSRSTGAPTGVARRRRRRARTASCRSSSTAPTSASGASSRNGLQLRLLRDNASLTRQAYVEFDLEAMFDGEVYADFVAALARLPPVAGRGRAPARVLARALDAGGGRSRARARSTSCATASRTAIAALGRGLPRPPGQRDAARGAARRATLDTQDYYRELLRLVYRLLFLFVAEDRDLLLDPEAPTEAARALRALLLDRAPAPTSPSAAAAPSTPTSGERPAARDGRARRRRGLPRARPAGARQLPLVAEARARTSTRPSSPNRDLLDAVRALAYARGATACCAPVDYRNLGAEELGCVYESLLELHPELDADAAHVRADDRRRQRAQDDRQLLHADEPDHRACSTRRSTRCSTRPRGKPSPRQAILDLKVCDPACGCGHFLSPPPTGSPSASPPSAPATRSRRPRRSRARAARRHRPLHLRRRRQPDGGRALQGQPLAGGARARQAALVPRRTTSSAATACSARRRRCSPSGIPDEAFEPIEGDDKEVASALRKRNRHEREGQLTLEDEVASSRRSCATVPLGVECGRRQLSRRSCARRRKRYRQLVASRRVRQREAARRRVVRGLRPAEDGGRTADHGGRRAGSQRTTSAGLAPDEREIEALRKEYAFFHWHVEFPQVFRVPEHEEPENEQTGWSGGFDCVIGNPPWERVTLKDREWFSARRPDIAAARTGAERNAMITALRVEDPDLLNMFVQAKRTAAGEKALTRDSAAYPLCGVGDVNTFALFAERMRSLVATGGRAGMDPPHRYCHDEGDADFLFIPRASR